MQILIASWQPGWLTPIPNSEPPEGDSGQCGKLDRPSRPCPPAPRCCSEVVYYQLLVGLKETGLGLMEPTWNWALGHDWGLIRTGSLGINKDQLSIFCDADRISGRNACVVCRIVLSTWPRLKSSQRRESWLRKCLHRIRLCTSL